MTVGASPQLRSEALYARSRELFTGGVNSPLRAFGPVGGIPPFISHGKGSHVVDADGRTYIDYVLAYGPMILGHAHPQVVASLTERATLGTVFGAPSELEIELAELIQSVIPSFERVRFVNSGTEATMSALRLARAYTGRSLIVKFDGHYHGHADIIQTGDRTQVLSTRFNDQDAIEAVFAQQGRRIAALIVEPVAGNMGVVPPRPGFLRLLRELCDRYESLLIFDEVMTGFRVHASSAQALYGVIPDLTTLGKVIGGGLPIGAYGGRRDIMSLVAPAGPLYQAGTFSGNAMTMAAGVATLRALRAPGAWEAASRAAATLAAGLTDEAGCSGVAAQVQRVGTMLSVFFSDEPVVDHVGARRGDAMRFAEFFHSMLNAGVYLPPSQLESWFVSTAHDTSDIEVTLDAANHAFGYV